MSGKRSLSAGGGPENNRDRNCMCRYQELGMIGAIVYFIVDSAGKYLSRRSAHNFIVILFEYRVLNSYQLKGTPSSGTGNFVNIAFEFNQFF